MIKRYCDRCGKEISGYFYTISASKDRDFPFLSREFEDIEVCEECHAGFVEWSRCSAKPKEGGDE